MNKGLIEISAIPSNGLLHRRSGILVTSILSLDYRKGEQLAPIDLLSGVESDKDVSDRSLTSEWLTTAEAADYLRMPIGTLRNRTSNGQIRFYKIGRSNRYRRSDLQELLLANAKGAIYGY